MVYQLSFQKIVAENSHQGNDIFNSCIFFSFFRTLFIDLERTELESVITSDIGCLFSPDQYIAPVDYGSGNNFITAKKLIEKMTEIKSMLRQEIESCDFLHICQLFHSVGGGAGCSIDFFSFHLSI